jgi:hypothetical protein
MSSTSSTDAATTHRLDVIIWSTIGAVAALVLTTAAVTDFRIDWPSFLMPGGTAAALLIGQRIYRTRRPDPRLANALGCTAQIIAFAAVGAPLSYIGASTDLPLHDRWFDAIDRALGFDFQSALAWMNAHTAAHFIFSIAYASLMPQTVIVVLALAAFRRMMMLRIFVLSFAISALLTIAIAAALPSEGVWGYYHLTAADYPNIEPVVRGLYLPAYHGLRDGSVRDLVATGASGIVTFPSLHCALGLILTVCLWPVRAVRWVALIVNATMLMSIPVDGGHYVVDIIGGIAVAVVSLAAAGALVRHVAGRAALHPIALAPTAASV